MKQLAVLIFFVICTNVFSQAPHSIPYQAVVRNTDGSVMSNTPLTMTFKIHDVSATGTVVYEESHNISSNAQGLVALNVGGGTSITGTFNTINWGNGAKFLHVLMNTGNEVVDLGTQQMMSVPYALHANDITLRVSLTGDSLFIGDQVSIVPGVSEANEPPLFTNGSGAVDSQGNSYNTIIIGEQEWFSGYLKSDYFTNGERLDMHDLGQCYSNYPLNYWNFPHYTLDTIIPMIADYWLDNGQRSATDSIFGHFYTMGALVNTRNICPIEYSIPTKNDIKFLLKNFISDYDTTSNDVALSDGELITFWNELHWKVPVSGIPGNPNTFDYDEYSSYSFNMEYIDLPIILELNYPSNFWVLQDSFFLTLSKPDNSWHLKFEHWDDYISNLNNTEFYFPTKCIKKENKPQYGCTDSNACNFHEWADTNDNSCYSVGSECDDKNGNTVNDVIDMNCECQGIMDTLPNVIGCENAYISIEGCGGESSIDYYGKTYNLVEIGNQCWFAEDLQTIMTYDSIPLMYLPDTINYTAFCYDHEIPKVFNFTSITNLSFAINPNTFSYNQATVIEDKICPIGWHIPSKCEWNYLFANMGATTEELNSNEIGCLNNINGDFRPFNSFASALGDNTMKKEKAGFNGEVNFGYIIDSENQFLGEIGNSVESSWWYGSENYLLSNMTKRALSSIPTIRNLNGVTDKSFNEFYAVRCIKGAKQIYGCMDISACNFNIEANHDDGSCLHVGDACNDSTLQTMNDVINDACECIGHLIIDNPVNQGNGVTDIDGNVYSTVVIGNQVWMSENLKTSRFRNGDHIEQFKSLSSCIWDNVNYTQHSPTYLISNNDMINNSIYGKMYNFYAANDPRGVCPTGWRLPNDSDMYELVDFITPLSPIVTDMNGQRSSSLAGGKLKAFNGWGSPNEGATNESGFSALPGGGIYLNGSTIQYYSGSSSSWWLISPEYNQNSTIETDYIDRYFSLVNSSSILNLNSNSTYPSANQNAHYIRCIKD